MLTARTSYCGDLRSQHIGAEHVLMGWVQKRRDHGGLIFVDLRDRTGIVQIVMDPLMSPDAHATGHDVRTEYVLAMRGTVRERPEGTTNPGLPTGEVEIVVHDLEVLNPSRTPPFPIEDDAEVAEEVRLTYRYLDMRRPSVARAMRMRHRTAFAVRQFMDAQGFLEVETPVLTKSTPEGARDFLVPSRLSLGEFYAMPQSPQLFKQMLMIGGVDRYFQIVKCFRDEDLRADRQPEFTQIDVEMAFAGQNEVFATIEGLMREVFSLVDADVQLPIDRMPHAEAVARYGTDRPDRRFGLELIDITNIAAQTDFRVFKTVLEKDGLVKGIRVPNGATLPRSEIDDLTTFVARFGAKGLAWMRVTDDGFDSSIVKFFTDQALADLREAMAAESGDLLLFVADQPKIVHDALGALRLHLGKRLNLIDTTRFDFLWVVDFPLFQWDEDAKRWDSEHHPFTAPHADDVHMLDVDPGKVRSQAYDLVINGNEIFSGSVRIHRREVQEKIFDLINLTREEAQARFGFFLDALQFGTPPHAGIAGGLDRLVLLLTGGNSLRDVIPFPKTQKGTCLVTGAPSKVSPEQLTELALQVVLPEQE